MTEKISSIDIAVHTFKNSNLKDVKYFSGSLELTLIHMGNLYTLTVKRISRLILIAIMLPMVGKCLTAKESVWVLMIVI